MPGPPSADEAETGLIRRGGAEATLPARAGRGRSKMASDPSWSQATGKDAQRPRGCPSRTGAVRGELGRRAGRGESPAWLCCTATPFTGATIGSTWYERDFSQSPRAGMPS